MDVKQNAKLVVVKGDNVHEYHVPPSASLPECYDVVREILGYLFDRIKTDMENQKKPEEPVKEAPVEIV